MKSAHFKFTALKKADLPLSERLGEIKLGQRFHCSETLHEAQFVLLGISEDIGPQMNHGAPGANKGFDNVLNKLCNMQSNVFLNGQEIGILGEIQQTASFTTIESCTDWVEKLDELVFNVLQHHVQAHQTLIVLGGGHNNALPILRFEQFRSKSPVFSINIDPHADCRSTEYRHSGNPFSYAHQEGVLAAYGVFGLHEAYNNSYTLDQLNKMGASKWTYEGLLDNADLAWKDFLNFVQNTHVGAPMVLDIDLDGIAFLPSSAITPSGFSNEQMRNMIRKISKSRKISAFHLPEGAPNTPLESAMYGKLMAYFITDFIKGQNR